MAVRSPGSLLKTISSASYLGIYNSDEKYSNLVFSFFIQQFILTKALFQGYGRLQALLRKPCYCPDEKPVKWLKIDPPAQALVDRI